MNQGQVGPHRTLDRVRGEDGRMRELAIEFARSAHGDKCRDVVVIDVRGLSQVTDFLVIATGTSDRQMGSVLDHIEDLARNRGVEAFRVDRDAKSTWVLADFIDVVVHLFEPNARAHYDLEMLWGDGERVAWERPGTTRAGP